MERICWKFDGLFKGDAEKCHAECESLEELTPENVLSYAEDEDTELHKCFCWDNDEAAHRYRLIQARQIIQSFVITREEPEEDTPKIRAFQITTERNVYQPTRMFLQNRDEYKDLIARAKQELAAFKQRYKMLSELENIFNEIDRL